MGTFRKQSESEVLQNHRGGPQTARQGKKKLRRAAGGHRPCDGDAMKPWKRIRYLLNREAFDRELQEEMRIHREMAEEKLSQLGTLKEEAHYAAMRAFGNATLAQEASRAEWTFFFESLVQDICFGVRMLRKSPGFTAVAVLTLALGIGANTALFSVINGVLLSPLPYAEPDRLVALYSRDARFTRSSISYPNFLDWVRDNRSFSALAGYREADLSLTGMGEPERVSAEMISASFFPLLGVRPVIGRTFLHEEDQAGARPVVLISGGLWKRKFGSAPDAVGKTLTLDGVAYTIVGVIPADFRYSGNNFQLGDVYTPLGQWSDPTFRDRRAGMGTNAVGRLKPGVSFAQAKADMDGLGRHLAEEYPEACKGAGITLLPLKQNMVGYVQPFLLVLLAAVGFVLLIACVNVANLLLARSTARTREFAVRISLGASRRRIIRQLLTESILLAGAGGTLGLALAAWGESTLVRTLPATLPRAGEIKVDAHVLIFTMVASLLSGVVFGLAPALKTSRADLLARTRTGGHNVSRARHRAQGAFVVVEIGMALVLLVGAGLMVRSLTALWSVDPGFDSRKILTFSISLPPSMMKAPADAVRAAFRELDDKIASVPGVRAEAPSWGSLPLQSDDETLFWMDGQPKPASPNDMNWAVSYVVGPDYLKVMRTPLLRGRFLEARDNEHSPLVAVIDEAFAAKFFHNQDPIGKRIYMFDNTPGASSPMVQIVGLVKHVKQWSLDADEKSLQAQMYRPFMQLPDLAMALSPSGTGILVRSEGDPTALFASIRAVLLKTNA